MKEFHIQFDQYRTGLCAQKITIFVKILLQSHTMRHSQIFLLTVLAAILLCVSACTNKQSARSIPADKKEIIDRFLDGTLDPSYTPALFFGHFGGDQKLGEGAVQAHLSLFLKGGADILKIQTEQPMPYVEDLTMDTPLVPEDWYAPTVEVIKEVLSYVGKDVYVMPTILSTHQVARQGFGDDRLPAWSVERPEAYKRMLDSYTQAILWYIRECKKIGVEAFFTATQGGEQKFYELAVPGGFFETWIKPYDMAVMTEAAKDTKFTILHICDWEGPMDDLTRYLDYPGKIVNVPLKIADTPLSLTETYEMFGRPVLGGFNRKAEIGKDSPEKIAEMTREIIAGGPKGHLMIGADCSVPDPLRITDNIHAAVSTAHGR
jgi:uroporphyrinogen decarboxylase